jgi:hypothetical protein
MIFQITQRLFRPLVIVSDQSQRVATVRVKELDEPCVLVSPSSPREVLALQMLEHQKQKFAPAEGNGVVITKAALQMLNAPTRL